MINLPQLNQLLKIAELALAVDVAEVNRRDAESNLRAAYEAWKMEAGIWRIETNSPDWHTMLKASDDEYQIVQDHKRLETNARKRLKTAIRKFKTTATQ